MLSGNEHCHDERLTADDADGKAGSLAVVRLIRIRLNQKIPIVDELSSNGAKLYIFFQDAVLQNVGREEGITDPVSFAGRGRNSAQNSVGTIRAAIFIFGIFG